VARYRVFFEGSDEDGYTASSPDLPGVRVAGATQDEVKQRLREAIAKREAERRQTRDRAREQPDAGNALVMDPDAA
jgi:predicted RNase H-like HicB family nuclease